MDDSARRAFELETRCLMRLVALYLEIFVAKGFDIGLWKVEPTGVLSPKILCHEDGLQDMLLRLPVRTSGDAQPFFADRWDMLGYLDRVAMFCEGSDMDVLRNQTERFVRLQQARMALDVDSILQR